ncbi:hypothetical protein KEJ15_08480, partial [Candidatus Bathyarchaeota archaeon]|nr:hypothetical protein [Candidatus Bathyarchaeota archaeon]
MKIKNVFTKENAVNGLKSLGKLRIKTDHDSLVATSALLLILFIAFGIRLFPLRWEIQTESLHISEFDGYFQLRFTDYIVKNGLISWAWPTPWNDTQRWYPRGINVATAGFPSLPMTAAVLYSMLTMLGIDPGLMNFAAILPAFLGMLASLVAYFLGKDVGGKPVGLFAALFLALSPSYIQRSSLGWFDDEIIGIFSLLLFILLFLRSIEVERPVGSAMKYSLGSALVLGYFCAGWGAAYYPIGVIALFTFLLILMRRYTQRLLLSYSLTFGLGLFIAISVPKIGSSYLTTVAILPVAIVFVLLCLCETFRAVETTKWKIISVAVFLAILIGGFTVLWQLGYAKSIAGKFISVINPFERAAAPLIESVAEHRISSWSTIYYDFGITILFFIAGLYFAIRNLNDKNLFLVILGITSLYFASSMVRLIVLMAPAFALVAAVGTVGLLKPFVTLLKEPPKLAVKRKFAQAYVGKEFSGLAVIMIFIILTTSFAFPMPKVYRQIDSPITITASSLPIVPNAPVREWLDMLEWTKNNLQSSTVVCSWWDYGYWLTVMGNVTSLADNATIDTDQIQNIGFIFMADEDTSMEMLKRYNATYILVFVTAKVYATSEGAVSYVDWAGFGDEGKWMWMARISGQAQERFVKEENIIDEASSWSNETSFGQYNSTQNKWQWNEKGMNTTVYKLMAWGKYQWCTRNGVTDREESEWQAAGLTSTDIQPKYFKQAYFAGLTLSISDVSKYGGYVPLICLVR